MHLCCLMICDGRDLGQSAAGRETLRRAMGVCPPALAEVGGAHSVAMLSLNAWDLLSMGNFPYASNYLIFQETHDAGVLLPPWPVRVACDRMSRDTVLNERVAAIAAGGGAPPLSTAEEGLLLARMLDATNVLNNASGAETCFAQPSDGEFDGIWDYQVSVCTVTYSLRESC